MKRMGAIASAILMFGAAAGYGQGTSGCGTPDSANAVARVEHAVLRAQQRPPEVQQDTSIASAIDRVRLNAQPHAATAILTQAIGPQPGQKLDALADSLVGIAVSYRPGDPMQARRVADAALVAITVAGSSRPLGGGTPYAGAFESLVRIYEGSQRDQATTLWLMTQLADVGPVLVYLHRVATSADKAAYRAVELLARDMGPAGLEILREAHREGSVTEPTARATLEIVARNHGWT